MKLLLTGAAVALIAGPVAAAQINVKITNEQADDGLFLTPLISVFHDGSDDLFDAGGFASAGVELVAEEGSPADLMVSGQLAVLGNPAGFGGAPVLDPGETAKTTYKVDGSGDLYWSFLSMVISSNDFFIGNDAPIQLFSGGSFTKQTISIYTSDVWDAGTEVNSAGDFGKAFNPFGGPAGSGDVEMLPITLAGGAIFDLNGVSTPVGPLVVPSEHRLLATIQISEVPVPAAFPLLLAGLGGFGLFRRRTR